MSIDWNYTQSKTTIEHLTVRYRGAAETMHVATLRTYIERLLDNVDLQPTGLSSGTILIVQKIQELAPLPTTALARSTQPERERWVEQVRNGMATVYATAVRPLHYPAPSNANAVLFADPAEMLACLSRDILNGQAWQHWYWQRVLSTVPTFPAAALTYLWSTQATFLPAALAALHPGEPYKAITLLSPVELRQVTHALHTSFDLSTSLLSLSEREYSSAVLASEDEAKGATSSYTIGSIEFDDAQRHTMKAQPIAPPWRRWLSDTPQVNVSPEAHYLLGLGLTLYHAPSFAKSTSFARQTATWLQSYKSAASNAASTVNDPSVPASSPETHSISTDMDRAIPSQHKRVEATPDGTSLQPPTATVPEIPLAKEQPHVEEGIPTITSLYIASEQEQLPHTQDSISTQVRASASYDTKAFEVGTAKPFPTEGIITELGGIFYLINLLPLLKSRLSDDVFTQYTSGWGVLEAVAKGLLETQYARYADDAIWTMLASLGRDRCIASYVASHEREEILMEAFRLLADLLHEPDADMVQIAEMVLCKYGRVIVSRTHVDLYMSMEEIILPIRRAGLDRDPGWVPDFARIVLFHFD